MKTRITFLFILIGSLGSQYLHGQDIKSNISGFSISAAGKFSKWTTSSLFLDPLTKGNTGPGFGFNLSYGFAEKISLYLEYGQSNFDPDEQTDGRHRALSAGASVHFGATLKSFRPFISAGLSSHSMSFNPVFFTDDLFGFEYDLKVSGIGAEIGVGTQWFTLPNLAITMRVNGQFGSFTNTTISGSEFDPDETLDYRLINIQAGVSYFFQ
jgi:hypothetical protein